MTRFCGRTLDEALTQACTSLRARVGELRYEVVEPQPPAGVTIEAEVDPLAVIGLFLSESFRAGRLGVEVRLSGDNDGVRGELAGDDLHLLTAAGGKGIDALQYLCNRVLSRRYPEHSPVHLDGDGFKARRAKQLQQRAHEAAGQVRRLRQEVDLGLLTPAARREVHLALADEPDVESESDGEGFLKRLVVRPRQGR